MIVSIFYCPGTTPSLDSGGLWRFPFACGCAFVVLEPTEMSMGRMRELDGIWVFVGLAWFAGLGDMDTKGLRESTWHGLNSKTSTRKCLSRQGRRS